MDDVSTFSSVSDEVLAAAVLRARRLINGLAAADLADISLARFETDAEASDRVLTSNFDRMQGAKRALRRIEDEIARRAAISRAHGAEQGRAGE
jgi:hypothetical protein